MKYSFMSFSCPEYSLNEILEAAKKYSYDAVELRIGSGHGHGVEADSSPETRADIREKIAKSGIDVCCLATSCRFANPENSEENVREMISAIKLAADIGCARIRVFGGNIPENISREEAGKNIVKSLKQAAPEAEKAKVTVCLETHDDWCDPEDVAKIMKETDHPNIMVNWDIMHPVFRGGKTMDEAYSVLKPWIRHVHFHDGTPDTEKYVIHTPVGEGKVDHKRAIELLSEDGYDGFMSGEWINWEAPEVHLPREIAILKKIESELGLR